MNKYEYKYVIVKSAITEDTFKNRVQSILDEYSNQGYRLHESSNISSITGEASLVFEKQF